MKVRRCTCAKGVPCFPDGSSGSNRRRGKEKSNTNTRVRRRTRTLKTRSMTRRVVM